MTKEYPIPFFAFQEFFRFMKEDIMMFWLDIKKVVMNWI